MQDLTAPSATPTLDTVSKAHTQKEKLMLNVLDCVTTARTGTNTQRQELISDEARAVRAAVAQYGTDAQRQALIDDPAWTVRKAVAQYGTVAQRQALAGDEEMWVRVAAHEN